MNFEKKPGSIVSQASMKNSKLVTVESVESPDRQNQSVHSNQMESQLKTLKIKIKTKDSVDAS